MDEDVLKWREKYASTLLMYAVLLGIPPVTLVVALILLPLSVFVPNAIALAFGHPWITIPVIAVMALFLVEIMEFVGQLIINEGAPFPQPRRNFFCAKCDDHIASDLPWKCGFCPTETLQPRAQWSFLGRCKHCKREAPAYECHHCGELLILITPSVPPKEGFERLHAARHASGHLPGQTHEEVHADRRRARDLTEATTLLTRAQTEGLRAEIEHLRESSRLQTLKHHANRERIDPAVRFGQQLAEAVVSNLDTIRTRQQLRDVIKETRATIMASEVFRTLSGDDQDNVLDDLGVAAEQLERSVLGKT